MHLAPLIQDLALVLGAASVVTFVFHRLHQPVVLGYLFVGLLLGPYSRLPLITELENIRTLGELGIIFLMFTLGLEFSFRKLARVGARSGFIAFVEMGALFTLGSFVSRSIGWGATESVFVGCAMAVSSTTIIYKALDELGHKTKRFAESIFGVLIVEDLVAILMIVALSSLAIGGDTIGADLLVSGLKLVFIVTSWFILGYFLVPRFINALGGTKNNELLMIGSTGLCLALVLLSAYFQYSIALGSFIMGSILAETRDAKRIEDLVRPLKDLFSAIFFVSVGLLLNVDLMMMNLPEIFLFTGVLLLGKTFFISLSSLLSGQTVGVSLQTGMGMAQIGEFSFIIATLGQGMGVLGAEVFPIIVSVSLLTTFTTPYMIRLSSLFAPQLEKAVKPRFGKALNRYSNFWTHKTADSRKKAILKTVLIRWLVNGFVVILIFTIAAQGVLPLLRLEIPHQWLSPAIAAASLLVSTPFIFAMLQAPLRLARIRTEKNRATDFSGGPLMLFFYFGTATMIGGLSLQFFTTWISFVILGVLVGVLIFAFSKQITKTYSWFEGEFLRGFESKPSGRRKTDAYQRLVPWDAHLAAIDVHPESEAVGKPLAELKLPARFGLNIVVIQRGDRAIIAPRAEEIVFPSDKLVFLGTDPQIDKIRPTLESPSAKAKTIPTTTTEYQLRSIEVEEKSYLEGKTIQNSKLRENFSVTIVGVEREGSRVLNPASSFKFKPLDLVWVVGEPEEITRISMQSTKRSA